MDQLQKLEDLLYLGVRDVALVRPHRHWLDLLNPDLRFVAELADFL